MVVKCRWHENFFRKTYHFEWVQRWEAQQACKLKPLIWRCLLKVNVSFSFWWHFECASKYFHFSVPFLIFSLLLSKLLRNQQNFSFLVPKFVLSSHTKKRFESFLHWNLNGKVSPHFPFTRCDNFPSSILEFSHDCFSRNEQWVVLNKRFYCSVYTTGFECSSSAVDCFLPVLNF